MKLALFVSTLSVLAVLVLTACSSHPIIPEAKNVEVSREKPDSECKDLGPVQGTVQSKSGKVEESIENMKLDAARKGANYIHMLTTSAYGTTTQGTAYFCP